MSQARRTWDGKAISPTPPFGAMVVVYRRGMRGVELLVLHRAAEGPDFAGDWAWTPPSGARLPEEPIEGCARRELAEETGLDLPLREVTGSTAEWAVYVAEAPPQAEVVLDAEHDRHRWVPPEEAARMCGPRKVADQIRRVTRYLGAHRRSTDAVLIDAGGVLTLPSDDLILRALSSFVADLDAGLLDEAHARAAAAADRTDPWGPDAHEAFLRSYAQAVGVSEARLAEATAALQQTLATTPTPWSRVRPGAVDGLRAIRETGVKIAIVSNAFGNVETNLHRLEVCQVGPGPGVEVDAVVDSGVVGVAKPDAAIFRLALERLDTSPQSAVHVGDSIAADVDGAQNAGLLALHFDPYELCPHDCPEHVTSLTDVARLVDTATP